MTGFLKRTAAVATGVALGVALVALVAMAGAWRDRPRALHAPPAPFQGARAPDTRA